MTKFTAWGVRFDLSNLDDAKKLVSTLGNRNNAAFCDMAAEWEIAVITINTAKLVA
jgi:hypothetical protein